MLDLLYIVTDPMTAESHLRPQLRKFVGMGWKVGVVYGGNKVVVGSGGLTGVRMYHVPMQREISPLHDLLTLVRLFALLLRLRPAIVNAGTPKAGLIGMIASYLARIPVRIYQLHGLRLETSTGWRRRLLLSTERIACWCGHKVLCVSPSLEKRASHLRLCDPSKLLVLGSGSCAGVEIADFSPTAERLAEAAELRRQLEIPADSPVVGFIGRLTKDKGIPELLQAFSTISRRLPKAHLLLVGPFEEGDPIPESARNRIGAESNIHHITWADDPRPYLHLMDLFALPSHREGLPGVLLEAAAAQKPIVATTATGIVDVLVHEVTGLLSPIGDAPSLAHNALRLLLDAPLAVKTARNALLKIKAEFSRDGVLSDLESFYMKLSDRSSAKQHVSERVSGTT